MAGAIVEFAVMSGAVPSATAAAQTRPRHPCVRGWKHRHCRRRPCLLRESNVPVEFHVAMKLAESTTLLDRHVTLLGLGAHPRR